MTQRNGEIDILRFLFATIILIFHYGRIWPISIGGNGTFGVEFFFLLSGFLMAKSAFKIKLKEIKTFGIPQIVVNFITKKLKVFYKYFLALFFMSYAVHAIIGHEFKNTVE